MDRRDFIKTSALIAGMAWLGDWEKAFAAGKADKLAGKIWPGWKKGEFQVHFIYTGVAESMFLIFPDGTTMLLDCGDHNAIGRGIKAVPVLPSPDRHAGEWIARYVERVNPSRNEVDYMMLSHYHSDHGGCEKFYASETTRNGEPYYLSGFSQAAEWLTFGKAIDRCWPDYNDPIPLVDDGSGVVAHMKKFYAEAQKHGTKIEKFRLGETNQIALVHHPDKYKNFSVRNISANGRLCTPDGKIIDIYKDYIKEKNPKKLNENGMSLGMIFQYGDFRFYTAGDFSDRLKRPDGTKDETEDIMAEVCGRANVAKLNHHGHYSMPAKLIAALRSQVYVSCVWDQLHNVDPVMARLSDKSIYPDERIICPGIMPAERRKVDQGKEWMDNVPKATYEGAHIILNVEPGGKQFSINMLTAKDESMRVESVMRFKTKK